MASAAPAPLIGGLVSFEVLANGKALDGVFEVLALSVTTGVNKIGSARLELVDGDPATGEFPVTDAPTLLPGTEITIKAGYDNKNDVIFEGIIVQLSLDLQEGQGVSVSVECRDKAIRTSGGRKNKLFEQQTTSAILTQLIGGYPGLEADIAATAPVHEELTQANSTDWDFIVTQAEANGHLVLNHRGKITTVAPTTSGPDVLTLEYGDNVYSFALDMDARTQFTAVKARAWSPQQQQMIEVTGAVPSVETLGNVPPADLATASAQGTYIMDTTAAVDQASLQALVDAYVVKQTLAKVQGSIEMPGTPAALPGSMVSLKHMGARFSGRAFISEVTHAIAYDWKTRLGVGLDEQWFAQRNPDVAPPVGAGNLPGVSGLYVATVQQIQPDPAKEFRVQVKVPTLDNTVWARLAQPYATAGAGAYFYPEIGDEVILAYFGSDTRYPVILGALYSSGRAPAYTPDQKNTKKGLVTAGNLTLEFDDAQKIITLKTPGDSESKKNNKLVISDAAKGLTLTDQQENTITMAADGLTLNSKSSVKITAANDITLESTGGSITIKAAQKVSLTGISISAKGSGSLDLETDGMGSLSADGILTVKGALVNIN